MSEWAWTDEEELLIAMIEENESVPRAEAIRRMQRRKKAAPSHSPGRLCENPRCTKGEGGGPNSLAHLRADARYCDATCKKAVQRSPNRQKQPSNRQCLCGSKRGQIGRRVYPYQEESSRA